MKQRLNLEFKGERDYLQGPDMFNATLNFLVKEHARDEITNIDFSFHRMARRAVDLYCEQQTSLGKAVAECSYSRQGALKKVYLYESEEPVSGRYPYDESRICRDFTIDTASATGSVTGELGFSEIEVWVALTKALHQGALSEVKGKWLFVRAKFPKFVQHPIVRERVLTIISNFQNRLTRTQLVADGVPVGEIFFSII